MVVTCLCVRVCVCVGEGVGMGTEVVSRCGGEGCPFLAYYTELG